MLGQPISMLLPQVIGFRLTGELREGATATDLVLTVTEMLREKGVVSKFVEFFGPGIAGLGLADRATIGNMSPEFGSTCAIFPVDAETLRYLEFTGRPTEQIELVDAYTRQQGLFHEPDAEEPTYSDTLELDLGDVEPSIAGPEAPPGPDRALRREERLPRGDAGMGSGGRQASSATAATRRSTNPSRPPTRRRRTTTATAASRAPMSTRVIVAVHVKTSDAVHGPARERRDGRARPRPCGDRGDHQLHQHLQPLRDARRRAARQEGGRAWPAPSALGEDLAGARLDGGHRVPGAVRPRRVPRPAPVQPGRLRLHDLHRELGAPTGGDLEGGQRQRPRRLLRALRATATSRAGSTRIPARTTSPRRPWWLPTH